MIIITTIIVVTDFNVSLINVSVKRVLIFSKTLFLCYDFSTAYYLYLAQLKTPFKSYGKR
jgi:hypothetical protein